MESNTGTPQFLLGRGLGKSPPHFVEKLQDAFDLMNRLDGSEMPEEVGEHGLPGGGSGGKV